MQTMTTNEEISQKTETLLSKLAGLANVNLESVLEEDPDQIQNWYEWLLNFDCEELLSAAENGDVVKEDVDLVFSTYRLIMQLVHAQSEDLKEIIEKDAAEAVEREENWSREREILSEEVRTFRDAITSNAGIDNINEAFRAEIDNLTAENEALRNQTRERDRELAEQRDRTEELDAKIQSLEKEKSLFTNNQIQLEETIRELTRRVSVQADATQRSWESKKLRQRNEQALLLSEQLKDIANQNDELKVEVERLTKALADATKLIEENSEKWKEYNEQLVRAEEIIQQLTDDNKQLKNQLREKDKSIDEKVEKVEVSGKEFVEVVQSKDIQIEKLKAQVNKKEMQMERLKAQIEMEHNEEKELELDKLRKELESAIEMSRKLFGTTGEDQSSAEDGPTEETRKSDSLRLRLVQAEMELDSFEQKLKKASDERMEIEYQMEGKDLMNARLLQDIQRYRKMAFGNLDENVRGMEKQLEFRDHQIEELIKHASLLQIELHELKEGLIQPKEIPSEKKAFEESKTTGEEQTPKKHIHWKEKVDSKGQKDDVILRKDEHESDEEDSHQSEIVSYEENEIENEQIGFKGVKEAAEAKREVKVIEWTKELESKADLTKSLYQELIRLRHELEKSEQQINALETLNRNHEKNAITIKNEVIEAKSKFKELRQVLFGPGDDAMEQAILNNDVLRLMEKNEALEIENMELRRLAENVETSGQEFERRMAEGSRRLVFLAIQNVKLERRVEIGQRLRLVLATENDSLQSKNLSLIAGEDGRLRELALENDAKMFEIARLQNALIHSIPYSEYRRVQKQLKALAFDRVFGVDGGYCSGEEEDKFGEYDFEGVNISRTAYFQKSKMDEIVLQMNRLEQMNKILEGQNSSYKWEIQKQKAQLQELEAFISDIEGERELNSLIVSIERRFLQALKEQFKVNEQHLSMEKQVKYAENKLKEIKQEWESERQHLINVIFRLKSLLDRTNNPALETTMNLSFDQISNFANRIQEFKEKEEILKAQSAEIDKKELELEQNIALFEATKASIETILSNDCQLEQIKIALQGYHLNVLILSSQLRKVRTQLQKSEKEAREREEELNELHNELDNFHFVHKTDFFGEKPTFEPSQDLPISSNNETKISAVDKSEEDIGERRLQSAIEQKSSSSDEPPTQIRTVIIDNSKEYDEKIKQIERSTTLCLQSYKEQLQQKEKAIEEYRQLLQQFHRDYYKQSASPEESFSKDEGFESESVSQKYPASAELIEGKQQKELHDSAQKIRVLERQIIELKEDNEELKDMIDKMVDELNIARKIDEQRKSEETAGKILKEGQSEDGNDKQNEASKIEKSSTKSESSSVDTEQDDQYVERKTEPSDSGSTANFGNIKQKSPDESKSTYVIAVEDGNISHDNQEKLIMRYRNDIRKLRMRITAMERRNKQLSEEHSALKERTRYTNIHKTRQEDGGINLIRKENDKLSRLNSILNKSHNQKSQELEEALSKLGKYEKAKSSQNKAELWEERKKHEHSISQLNQKVTELRARESGLIEKLERREKLIEQLGKTQNERLIEGERFQGLMKEWRLAKENSDKKEIQLTNEININDFTREREITDSEEDHFISMKQLRRAELLRTETLEQFNSLKKTYDQLLMDYNRIINKERERQIQTLKDSEEESLAGVVLLADKLKAKDVEIDKQRCKIFSMERRIRELEDYRK